MKDYEHMCDKKQEHRLYHIMGLPCTCHAAQMLTMAEYWEGVMKALSGVNSVSRGSK